MSSSDRRRERRRSRSPGAARGTSSSSHRRRSSRERERSISAESRRHRDEEPRRQGRSDSRQEGSGEDGSRRPRGRMRGWSVERRRSASPARSGSARKGAERERRERDSSRLGRSDEEKGDSSRKATSGSSSSRKGDGDRREGDRREGYRREGDRREGDRREGDKREGDRREGDKREGKGKGSSLTTEAAAVNAKQEPRHSSPVADCEVSRSEKKRTREELVSASCAEPPSPAAKSSSTGADLTKPPRKRRFDDSGSATVNGASPSPPTQGNASSSEGNPARPGPPSAKPQQQQQQQPPKLSAEAASPPPSNGESARSAVAKEKVSRLERFKALKQQRLHKSGGAADAASDEPPKAAAPSLSSSSSVAAGEGTTTGSDAAETLPRRADEAAQSFLSAKRQAKAAKPSSNVRFAVAASGHSGNQGTVNARDAGDHPATTKSSASSSSNASAVSPAVSAAVAALSAAAKKVFEASVYSQAATAGAVAATKEESSASGGAKPSSVKTEPADESPKPEGESESLPRAFSPEGKDLSRAPPVSAAEENPGASTDSASSAKALFPSSPSETTTPASEEGVREDSATPAVESAEAASAASGAGEAASAAAKGNMKPPKPMSRARLKKKQQAMLLDQLRRQTQRKAGKGEEETDADMLDSFMSALEKEAKEELKAARGEDAEAAEALRRLNQRTEAQRVKSISLEEIERWSEVEASFLPESAKQSAVRSEAPKTPSLQQPSLKSHSEEEGASESPSLQESNSASPCPAVQKVSASEETESSSQMQMPGVKTETPAAADSAPSATSEASVTQAEKDSPAEGPASSAEAGEDEDEEGKYHALFMAELKAATAKEAAAKEASAKAAKDKLQQREKAESEAEEEEPLYSDHDDDDERPSAEDAAGDPTKAKEGAGEEDQAKEQLANLSYFDLVKRVGLKKELPIVNHALCKFPPIKKNLYVQVKELTDLKDHEVESFRKTNGNIKVRGKQCPRPISTFYQCGLPDKILRHLEARGFEKPFPIQMQCIPALMCGRDVIAVAETGSGKTLAYSLPLVRHVVSVKKQYKDFLANRRAEKAEKGDGAEGGQQPAEDEDEHDRFVKNEQGERQLVYGGFKEGMIALVIAPTRELCVQISKEMTRLCKLADLSCVALYGGAGISGQLGQIRRGADVVVGTPGRLIDVLTLNSNKFTSVKRVTFVVLDEADRMFDFGFEPQISSILRSTRLDRQTCLFSATFPSHIEALARRILYKPIEVIIGEKGRTAAKVQQYVEVLTEERKFLRLLQLLGDWQDYGSIIVFVNKQIEADELFTELLKYGYNALVLHGGQDQTDREFTIQEFKEGSKTLLIATSVAARGLDVPSVVLVINFRCPSHIEDYVHRIGRTGRAGNVGVAYTFITDAEADRAEEIEAALIQSGQDVPVALSQMAAEFRNQCNLGFAQKKKRGGFGGKGFTFHVSERSRQQLQMQAAKKELAGVTEADEVEEVELLLQRDDILGPPPSAASAATSGAAVASAINAALAASSPAALQSAVEEAAAKAALLAKHQLATGGEGGPVTLSSTEAVARVKLVAKVLKLQDEELAKRPPEVPPPPPYGLPPPGCFKTNMTIDEMVSHMVQQALKNIPPEKRAEHEERLRDSYKKHLTAAPKIQQKAAPGMQLAVASSVTGSLIPKKTDTFMEAVGEALSILKEGHTVSTPLLQAAFEKIKAFADTDALSAAISSVSAPSNPTVGKVPGLSARGFVCPETGNFVDELEINDYPQVARYKLTQKELMGRIMEQTGAVLYVKGQHVDPALKHRTHLAPGVKLLYVEIIAPTPIQVQRARNAVYELVESIALKSLNLSSTQRQAIGKYSVV